LPNAGLKREHTVILLVEDDEQTREFYRHAIKAAGHEVAAVEDGLAALRRIDIELPDVIVLDLVLPRLGGVDVFQELRSHPATREIPVIAVTGADRLRSVDTTEFNYFLRKPVSPEVLVATIDQALRRAQPTG
jgi:two-component system, OmpR family, phosphate regulon response regulator PhoB